MGTPPALFPEAELKRYAHLGMSEQYQFLLDYFASFIVTVIIVNYLYSVVINSN